MKTLRFKRGLWYVLEEKKPYKVFNSEEEAQAYMNPRVEKTYVEKMEELLAEDEIDLGESFEQ